MNCGWLFSSTRAVSICVYVMVGLNSTASYEPSLIEFTRKYSRSPAVTFTASRPWISLAEVSVGLAIVLDQISAWLCWILRRTPSAVVYEAGGALSRRYGPVMA